MASFKFLFRLRKRSDLEHLHVNVYDHKETYLVTKLETSLHEYLDSNPHAEEHKRQKEKK